jgi:hypothetical protein
MIIECGADHVPGLHDLAGVQAGNGRFAGAGAVVPPPPTHNSGGGWVHTAGAKVFV